MARERTKARIAHLEELVDNFRRQDDNERVATLMEQLEEVSKERDTLAKTLDNIRSLIGDNRRSDVQDAKHEEHKDTAEARGEEQPPQPLHQRTSVGNASVMSMPASHQPQSGWSAFPTTQHRHDSDVSTIDYSQRAPASSVWSLDMSGDSDYISSFGDLPQTSAPRLVHSDSLLAPDQLSGPIVPQPSQCCECSTPKQPFQPGTTPNKWRIANEVLIQRSRLQPAVQRLEDNMSDDTPVRALVEGWDAVDKRGPLSASWQLMRGIDQSLCFSMGFIERLAIMKIMHTLLLYHCDPSPERLAKVPPWYLKRPCQETIPHSYAIDFFAWPGLRERFIFHQHRYCTNTFWRFFCTSLHVLWSGGLHDTFTHSTQTGLYTISQPFIDRISDLSSWTMSNEIFQHFPELYSDIPVFNSIPGSLAPNVPHQLITAATAPAAGRHITKGLRLLPGMTKPVNSLMFPDTISITGAKGQCNMVSGSRLYNRLILPWRRPILQRCMGWDFPSGFRPGPRGRNLRYILSSLRLAS
ncbi:hypothetical protein H2203_000975 [Taxawa tesnikishii (nom. ined.)]|nr:hypothetical protein H2203_000975 [Dothideales sp. JES 119]